MLTIQNTSDSLVHLLIDGEIQSEKAVAEEWIKQ